MEWTEVENTVGVMDVAFAEMRMCSCKIIRSRLYEVSVPNLSTSQPRFPGASKVIFKLSPTLPSKTVLPPFIEGQVRRQKKVLVHACTT